MSKHAAKGQKGLLGGCLGHLTLHDRRSWSAPVSRPRSCARDGGAVHLAMPSPPKRHCLDEAASCSIIPDTLVTTA